MAVATKLQAQATLYLTWLMFIPLVIVIIIIGLAMHATYHNCDPLISGAIKSGDQIVPYYILDLLGEYKGVPGLLTASIFAAALSSVSAVCNSLAAVWLEDVILPAIKAHRGIIPSDKKKRWIAVGLVIFFGLVTIGLSFLASSFTSKLVQATGTIWGVLGGPLGGIFVMGFFLPFCNSAGAISGMIGGVIFALWVSLGSVIYSPTPTTLNITPNMTVCHIPLARLKELAISKQATTPAPPALIDLYSVSYAWYGVIGMGSCIIIGIVVSLATIWIKKCRPRLARELMFLCCCENAVFRLYKAPNSYEFNNTEKSTDNDVNECHVGGSNSTANIICIQEVDSNGTSIEQPDVAIEKSEEWDGDYENTAFENDEYNTDNGSINKNYNYNNEECAVAF
jgi:sodium-dependent multivitamin transporter 6/sodium-coupled monocarboxylate transporter 8/12